TAAIMNRYFVNIKVDREERPDVDKVYMSAVQTMVGQGGWPLSVFLTPDLKPFYGGTYFPPKDGYGRPGFPTLLERINEVWQNERENVTNSGDELTKQLQHRHPVDVRSTVIDETILKRTYHQIAAGYDTKYFGFGSGTKFPRPVVLNFLFRYHYRTKDQEALKMALTTLMAMASGGMVDHLAGGFHRYSVDVQWRVPHFEKMLYDQAQLIHSYLDAYQITHDEFFAAVARETLEYVLREMTLPEGGFASAEDADSPEPGVPEHSVEGAFYVWTKSEIDQHLTAEESRVFCHYYSVRAEGNALSDPHNEFTGKNILFNPFTIEQTAEQFSLSAESVAAMLASAKKKLLAVRGLRGRPLRDDKVLTAWNGLMLGALARAGRIMNDDRYTNAAIACASFLESTVYDRSRKILSRRYRNGEVKFEGHLDDHSFLIAGLIELYQSSFDIRWLAWAEELMGRTITLFWDSAEGGFYDTSGKDSSILVRMKEAYDGAEPTGNSMAALSLLCLYHLTNERSLREYAEKTMKYFCTLLEQSPQIMPQMMAVVEGFIVPPVHLVIAGDGPVQRSEMMKTANGLFSPDLMFVQLNERSRKFFTERFPMMTAMNTPEGKLTAYYCSNFTCQFPTTDPRQLLEQMNRS
ncbi:MAG: thioredoxin domain-containing protein, partial [Bacteroidetes bacterium]|nr:thioredoxin domain-containing protein [Bacteroidota bacterium]